MVDAAVHSPGVGRPSKPVLGAADAAFAMPPLHCPFPAVPCHPAVDALIDHTLEWTCTRGLLPDEPGAAAKARSHGMLTALCYPTAPFDRLAIISDFINWLLSDDACENLSLDGAPPKEIHTFLSQIYAVIGVPDAHAQERCRGGEHFTEALRDIWDRISRASTPEWRKRFTRHVRNYIEGCVWEASNRNVEQIPSRSVYLSMRSYTSGMYLFWDFIEFTGGFLLPDTVVENPLVVELARAANMVVALSNDIFSLQKEFSNGDIHNIVIVLQQEETLTWEEACLRAARLHDAQVRHYCALERLLPSFGSRIDKDLARYCEGLRIWMRANYDWSTVTPRYNAA
jgi:hypothetical protein